MLTHENPDHWRSPPEPEIIEAKPEPKKLKTGGDYMRICQTCMHFKAAGDEDEPGNCLRYPPVVISDVREIEDTDDPESTWITTATISEFPEVQMMDRCGEWEVRGITMTDGSVLTPQDYAA